MARVIIQRSAGGAAFPTALLNDTSAPRTWITYDPPASLGNALGADAWYRRRNVAGGGGGGGVPESPPPPPPTVPSPSAGGYFDGATYPGRPTGSAYVRWEDLIGSDNPSDPNIFRTVVARVPAGKILTLPPGLFQVSNFNAVNVAGNYQGIRIGGSGFPQCKGIIGSGPGQTYFQMVPNTSTYSTSEVVLNGTNGARVMYFAGVNDGIVSGISFMGTDQLNEYNGLAIRNCLRFKVSWCEFYGFGPGSKSAPPGECFHVYTAGNCDSSWFDHLLVDGKMTTTPAFGPGQVWGSGPRPATVNQMTSASSTPLGQVVPTNYVGASPVGVNQHANMKITNTTVRNARWGAGVATYRATSFYYDNVVVDTTHSAPFNMEANGGDCVLANCSSTRGPENATCDSDGLNMNLSIFNFKSEVSPGSIDTALVGHGGAPFKILYHNSYAGHTPNEQRLDTIRYVDGSTQMSTAAEAAARTDNKNTWFYLIGNGVP